MTTWNIRYSDRVFKEDMDKIDRSMRAHIRIAIETKLLVDPMHFGKPLRYSSTHQRSLRVGDYRVLYCISCEEKMISVVAIGHRGDVYAIAQKR